MTTLEAHNITKAFDAVEVLRGISLTFQPGSVTALVGDNGAGKSTFLKILAGVHTPTGGKICLHGAPLERGVTASHREAGIEMVYQDLALAKNHDIVTNLFLGRERDSFGFLRRREMLSQAKTTLDQLEINLPRLTQKVGTLSGGQQQAVAIARAVLFNPKVLLLDEPTAALAAREVERVIDLIQKQKALGRIIILVSHRLNDVFAVADRIIVLKRGQVFSDDPSTALTLAEVVQRIVG
jgi:ABC-type sugar transport system ATPase subunit